MNTLKQSAQISRIYLNAFALVALSVNCLCLSAKGQSDSTNNLRIFSLTTTNFVSFIKTPPVIEHLIYKRTLFDGGHWFRSKQEAEAFLKKMADSKASEQNKSEEMFALRYESPELFMLQEINAPTNAWSSAIRLRTFVGKNERMWWSLSPNGATSTDAKDGIYKFGGEDNQSFVITRQLAMELFRLGMFDLDRDSIRKREAKVGDLDNELRFSGSTQYGGIIDGVAEATNGLISSIRYTIENQGGTIQGRIINIEQKEGVLSSLKVFNITKKRPDPVLYCSFDIISVRAQVDPLPPHACDIEQFLTPSDKEILIKADGEILDLRKGMRSVQIHNTDKGPDNQAKRLILRILLVAIIIVPLGILYYRRIQRRG